MQENAASRPGETDLHRTDPPEPEFVAQVRAEYERYIEKRNAVRTETSRLRRASLRRMLLG